jgi:energy-coupling factor transporter ATP-binding protein EcfA2
MDEPLSNLDAKLRVDMRAQLVQVHARLGITTVYVTHDQIEAMTLGQRVAVMRDGELQQVATPQYLYREPANLFVAARPLTRSRSAPRLTSGRRPCCSRASARRCSGRDLRADGSAGRCAAASRRRFVTLPVLRPDNRRTAPPLAIRALDQDLRPARPGYAAGPGRARPAGSTSPFADAAPLLERPHRRCMQPDGLHSG